MAQGRPSLGRARGEGRRRERGHGRGSLGLAEPTKAGGVNARRPAMGVRKKGGAGEKTALFGWGRV